MFSDCTINVQYPQFKVPTEDGEIYTNGGGEVGYAFLFIPSKKCALEITVENCCADSKKISELDLVKRLGELKIPLSSKIVVKVDKGLAEVVATESKEEGNFEGLEEIKKRYGGSGSVYWLAREKIKELYFHIMCAK